MEWHGYEVFMKSTSKSVKYNFNCHQNRNYVIFHNVSLLIFKSICFLLVHLFLLVYLSVCLFCEAVERCSMFAYFQVADNNLRSFKSNWNLELTCSSPPFKLDLYLHATILNRHRYNNGKQMESEKEGWGQQRWQRSRIHRAGTHLGFLKVVLVKGRKKRGKRLQRVENEHQPKGHSVNQQP